MFKNHIQESRAIQMNYDAWILEGCGWSPFWNYKYATASELLPSDWFIDLLVDCFIDWYILCRDVKSQNYW